MNPSDPNIIAKVCMDPTSPPIISVAAETVGEIRHALVKEGYFVVLIEGTSISSKEDLLRWLDQACSFPDYFAFNWDALKDVLVDFHWDPHPGYTLVYYHIENLDEEPRSTFLTVIQDASQLWATEGIAFKLLLVNN